MIPFTMEFRTERGIGVASLTGRLNAGSAPETKDRLKAYVGGSTKKLVLDMSGLDFIDSSGLAAIVAGYKAAIESGGGLKLAKLTPQVARVFALTRLDRVFETFPDLESALESFE